MSQNSSAYESSDNATSRPSLLPFSNRGSRTSHNPSTSSMMAEIGVTYDVRLIDEDEEDVFYNSSDLEMDTLKPSSHHNTSKSRCHKQIVKSASTSTVCLKLMLPMKVFIG